MSESLSSAPGVRGYLVSDLVGMALEQLGIGVGGVNIDPQGIKSGVMHLNMMLAQWQRRHCLVPNLVDLSVVSSGASVYYIGPGGDIDTPARPSQINAAYARLLTNGQAVQHGDFSPVDFAGGDFDTGNDGLSTGNPIDYALTEIPSYEDYASIGLKGLRTWPSYFFYNPTFPHGELRVWPIPAGSVWELHVIASEPLPATLSENDAINLPPEYWDAIMWSLAKRLAPSYGQEPSPTVVAEARGALATIRTANLKTPTLGMPAALTAGGAPFYWPGLETQKL